MNITGLGSEGSRHCFQFGVRMHCQLAQDVVEGRSVEIPP